MQNYSLNHLSDDDLICKLVELVMRDRVTTADLLAHIAEVDNRRLYAPAGYSSMHAYCVDELGLSEDAAYKRIQAARAGRRFPTLFTAVAEGRLHLAGVCLLAPHLTPENMADLVEAASHKRKSEIEELIAFRFGAEASRIRAITALASRELAPGQVDVGLDAALEGSTGHGEPGPEDLAAKRLAPGQVEHARSVPEPERYLIQVAIPRRTLAKLRYAQALMSHAIPSGDVAQVLDRALEALIAATEKRKVGSHKSHARRGKPAPSKRLVPADVRRAVWERDRGRCTFVSANGRRCDACRFLEFDHVDPVARGGMATVQNLRLRCRTHNQHEAERAFGSEFMRQKRMAARLARVKSSAPSRNAGHSSHHTRDVLTGLRHLGCRPGDARRAAEYSASLPLSTLEERMRAALQFLGGRFVQVGFPTR